MKLTVRDYYSTQERSLIWYKSSSAELL